jgi:exopolysaccharide production protein ExoQ
MLRRLAAPGLRRISESDGGGIRRKLIEDAFTLVVKRRIMVIQRKLLGDGFTLLVLFLATGAFQPLIVDPSDPRAGSDGSPLLRAVWFVVYGVVVFRLIRQYRPIFMLLRVNRCLLLLLLLVMFSLLWSQDPGLTLRKGIALLATTLIGVDFAIHYSVRDQLRMLYIVLGSVVVLGIGVQLFFPALIPTVNLDSEAWHGVSGHKNDWARMLVLATIALLSRSRRSLRDFLLIGILTLAAFGLVVLAHSIGALVILIVLLVLFKTFGILRWRPKILATACLASALIVLPMSYLLFQNFDKVTATLGRDASLTGRVDIWQLALGSIARNPIHGYGYSAFWEADSQAATRIREELNWAAPHAHNGYIDMTLELGLAGLFLFLASFVIAARRAVDCLQCGAEREAMWPLAYLSFFFLYQFTEGSLVTGNTIYWILYVAVCLSVTKVAVTNRLAFESNNEFVAPMPNYTLGQEPS